MGSFFSKSRKRKFSEVRDSDIQEKGCYGDINSQHDGLATGVNNEERTEVKLVEGLDQLYGEHDIQVSEGGEAELHKHRRNCKKNPGHTEFIPVKNFQLEHLPDGLRDPDIYELIMAQADLTVRVDVKMTSPARPQYWHNSKAPYPFYNSKINNALRTGTGRLCGATKYTEGLDELGDEHEEGCKSCPCHTCVASTDPSKVWWELKVLTATHVVFDASEARHASCKLFYDEPDSEVATLDHVTLFDNDFEEDWCVLKYAICDKEDLAGEIYDMVFHLNDVWRKMHHKYEASRDGDRLTFIVSHPHGCFKQVTVGRWVGKHFVGRDNDHKFTYTTSTCPGSSGATVYALGYNGGVWAPQPVHCGALRDGLNVSGAGDIM